jgi:3-hydroxyisobutyrate dehydrogenase-like beta-hydroxyacid dehydrogenase
LGSESGVRRGVYGEGLTFTTDVAQAVRDANVVVTMVADGDVTETEFPLRWAEKDLVLALSASAHASAALPILNEIAAIWSEAVAEFGSDDLSAVYLALQRRKTAPSASQDDAPPP